MAPSLAWVKRRSSTGPDERLAASMDLSTDHPEPLPGGVRRRRETSMNGSHTVKAIVGCLPSKSASVLDRVAACRRAVLKFKPGNRRQEGSHADLTGGSTTATSSGSGGLAVAVVARTQGTLNGHVDAFCLLARGRGAG